MQQKISANITRRQFIKKTTMASVALSMTQVTKSQANPQKKPPNIIFLMTDQHRADCLGCAGNPVIRTPNLDSIAKDGVMFSHAYTSTPSCTPARSGLLTGLSPWHHGMLGYGRIARTYPVELPRAIREAGYYTLGIGKMHWYPQKNLHGFHDTLVDESGRGESPGFVSDYRQWFRKQAPNLHPDATGIGWNDYRAKTYVLPEDLHPTWWTGEMAVDCIDEYDKDQPFLLKVSFARPHSPYDPPKRFMQMYRAEDMPKPSIGEWAGKFADHKEPAPYNLWHGNLGLEQALRSRRGYYGSITFIDEQIGRILQVLKKRGLYENSLIIFTADHGDMLGDHHHWRKTYPYEGSAKIPMLLRWPKSMGRNHLRGKKLPFPVELRDVLPTCLDAAGAAIPKNLDGKSMLKLVRAETKAWRPFIDLEHDVCYSRENHWNSLTDGRFKYIFHAYDGQEQLFDLINDPGEIRDLSTESPYQNLLKEWRQKLAEHFTERGTSFVKNGSLIPRPQRMLYSPHYPKS